MKLSEFLSQQAVKAGIDVNADANKAFFEAAAALTNEIPDTLAQGIDTKFITVDSAKNNHPEIKAHYQAQALNTVDKGYKEVLAELQVPQDVIDSIFQEQSTYKRGPLIAKTIKDLEGRKAAATSPDKAAIQKQIDDLQAALRTEKETTTRTLAEKAQFEKNMRLQYKKNALYANLKTIYDTLDPEEKNGTLDVIFDKSLQDNNALIDLDDHGNMVLLKKEGRTNYFSENNQAISPSQYLDGILSRKKLLVTTPAPAQPDATPTPGQRQNPTQVRGGNGNTVNPLYSQLNNEALKDYQNNSKVTV